MCLNYQNKLAQASRPGGRAGIWNCLGDVGWSTPGNAQALISVPSLKTKTMGLKEWTHNLCHSGDSLANVHYGLEPVAPVFPLLVAMLQFFRGDVEK